MNHSTADDRAEQARRAFQDAGILEEWPDPEPLACEPPQSAPYPVTALGGMAESAVRALVSGTECAESLAANVILSGIVAASHWRADVETLTGKRTTLSLPFFTVGRSGSRKSECETWVFRALRELEGLRRKQVRAEKVLYQDALAKWRKAPSGAEPIPPRSIRYIVSDFTPQGLRKYLLAGSPAVTVLTTEGGRLTAGHAMKLENRRATLAALCDLLDKGELDGMRAGNEVGDDGFLDGRRMALHVLIQPDAAGEFLSDRVVIDSGFASRVLLSWPTRPHRTGRAGFTSVERATLARFAESVAAPFAGEDTGAELSPPVLSLSPRAAEELRELAAEIETRMNPGGDLERLEDLVNKAAEQATRIAANLFVFENAGRAETLPGDYAARGVAIVRWYVAEQTRVAQARAVDPLSLTARRVLEWIAKSGLREVKPRDLVGGKVAGIKSAIEARSVLARLAAQHWLRGRESEPRVGRPSEVFDRHPRFDHFWQEVASAKSAQSAKGPVTRSPVDSADSAEPEPASREPQASWLWRGESWWEDPETGHLHWCEAGEPVEDIA